ncbi:MAG TPA: SCO family protein [Candidatus Sulfopaludibacter sp.]|jgi:protein SCO1/2|nr:SCO family protein [Candidatus Sulfopaludibacter sp.]
MTARAWGLAILLATLTACVQPKPLDDFGPAPSFQLTTETGQTFDSKSLAGHVWVADFVYTTCDGPCPMMSSQMRQIQNSTAAEMSDVRMVSFTVDPAHDTPPVLAAYAKHFTQNPDRWVFLTGSLDQLSDAGLGFKLNKVDGSLTHSSRFALVDRRGRIRGFYVTGDDGFMPRLMHDLRLLEKQ